MNSATFKLGVRGLIGGAVLAWIGASVMFGTVDTILKSAIIGILAYLFIDYLLEFIK